MLAKDIEAAGATISNAGVGQREARIPADTLGVPAGGPVGYEKDDRAGYGAWDRVAPGGAFR
jgi:hypothetical protein